MNAFVAPASEEALRLMGRVLRDGADLAPEYPLVFGSVASGNVVALHEDGRVRSACAVLTRELAVAGHDLAVGLIGSVATDAEHRGRGLATRVLDAAETTLRDAGCLLALLWADEPEFYARRGYAEVGREVVVLLAPELADLLPSASRVRELDAARDADAVHSLYMRHRRRVRRSARETAASIAAPGVRTFVAECHGRVVAYACEGRGKDLAGVVHEWGGAPHDVQACLRAHLAARAGHDDALFLLAPHAENELVRSLVRVGASAFTGVLAQGKLLDPDGALERIAAHSNTRLDLERVADDRWRVAHGARAVELDAALLRELLVAPRARRDAVAKLERDLDTRFPGLPLAPFLWGLDSI